MSEDSNYWIDRRPSRRWVLRTAGGIGAAGLLAACAPSQAPASSTTGAGTQGTAPTESVPQILRYGNANPPVTLDPNGSSVTSSYFYAIYDALTYIDSEAKVQPGLAESWKPVGENVWEFKLRKTKWSDGSDATADDVKWTYDYIINPANKSARASRLANVKEVKVVDPLTVQIVTDGPDPIMPKRAFFILILPKTYIEKIGVSEFGLKPIGTGGFKIKEYKQGERVVFVPNELSWRKPKLSELWLYEMPEAATRVAALRSGAVDAIDGVDRESAEQLKSDPALSVVVADGAGSYSCDIEYFKEPYTDVRIRQAINYAIDQEAILKNLLKGYGKVMDGQFVPRNVFGYNPNLKPYGYDPKKAKELITAAGFPNGFNTTIEFNTTSPEPKAMALAMFQYFADIGIKAELKPVEIAVWRQHLYEGGRAPIFYNPWAAQAPMDAEFILLWYSEKAYNGIPVYKNPAFEGPYSKSQQELDPAKRLTYLQQASAAMRDDPPGIFTIQTTSIWGLNKKVKSFVGTASGQILFDPIEIVKV